MKKNIEGLEVKLKDLIEYKTIKAAEEKELKVKVKKVDKKLKAIQEKEAAIKLEKANLKKEHNNKSVGLGTTLNNNEVELETKCDLQTPQNNSTCSHSPQCYTRQPKPPPYGPLSLEQVELIEAISRSEKNESEVESFVKNVMGFLEEEPKDIEVTIVKLEALKNMLEPNVEAEGKISHFRELINMAKNTKEIIDNMNNEQNDEDDDDYFYDEDDDLPRHFYGEDGEIIFEDE